MLTGALIASAAAIGGVVAPASAVEGDVSSATLDWGVKQSFRSYIASGPAQGAITPGAGASVNSDGTFRWAAGDGVFDGAVPSADVTFGGSVHFTGHGGLLDVLIENPRVDIDGSTGTLYADVKSKGLTGSDFDQDGVAFASLQVGTPVVNGDEALYTGVAATLTADGVAAFAEFYPAGTALDPLSFSLPYSIPTPDPIATVTALAAAPIGTAEEGTEVTFTATVTPAAAGTVQFATAAGALGAAVTVQNGTAVLTTSDLPVGPVQVTATYTPADSAAYLGSASEALAYTITAAPAPDADATATATVGVSPEGRAITGETVTLSTTVANADDEQTVPTGAVEFFSIAAGTDTRVSVGSAALDRGAASLETSALAAGGHTFVAVYTPNSNAFLGSESTASSNFGVIDLALHATCTPGANAIVGDTGATATWGWSAYASGWTKVAGGDVSVVDGEFVLTEGVATADDVCAQIAFTGTLRTEAYAGFFPPNGQWIELVDPTLTMSVDGSGSWTAGVRSGFGAYDGTLDAPRTTVATFSGQTVGGPGQPGPRTLNLDYAGTVALGTWNAAYANAWPAEFILAAPEAVQSFYYQTGETPGNLNKPAAPIAVDFAWPAVTTISASVSPEPRSLLGEDVTFEASVSPSTVPGKVRFLDVPAEGDERIIADVDVVDGAASIVVDDLVAGGHSLRAQFLPSNDFESSIVQIADHYGVVDTATPSLCEVPSGAETLTGVSAEWGWSAYSDAWTKIAGGNATVAGETFVLSNGTARVSEECTVVSFTGTLRTQAYEGSFPPNGQWIELVDPALVIDADGNGAWTAGVRTGIAAYNAATPAPRLTVTTVTGAELDFSGDSLSADVALDYTDTVAPGTWSAGGGVNWTSAWANEFILAAPAAIQAFYYQSGTSAANLTKPPAPVSFAWTAKAPSVTVAGPAGTIVPGATLTFSGSGYRLGEAVTATVFSEPIVVGTATADASGSVAFSWTVPAGFAPGDHRVELSGARSGTASAGFTVAASAIAPAPAAQVEERCVARAVNGATLDWGVKASFRSYVTGPIAGGSVSTSGVTATGDGFRWTGGSGAYNTDADRGRVAYSGSVHFTGHGGQLDLTIANPRVQVNGGSASLIADLKSTGLNGAAGVDAAGVVIASLGLPAASVAGDRISWNGASATLTAAGAEAFGGFYQAGQALDPVSFAFPLGAEVPCDSTTDGKLASTGADLAGGWIALMLLVLGAGAVFITRRRRATV
ncbi:HtaA domain-containing protein [Agromyces silvae]|uniref:HtaA domain-containing protein n=1 Tax=Agromyces silvae TaxID=3388266 RepID=UPI00280B0BD8|nr:HtaA domain-containing protein [Agromyces protaetiae]